MDTLKAILRIVGMAALTAGLVYLTILMFGMCRVGC